MMKPAMVNIFKCPIPEKTLMKVNNHAVLNLPSYSIFVISATLTQFFLNCPTQKKQNVQSLKVYLWYSQRHCSQTLQYHSLFIPPRRSRPLAFSTWLSVLAQHVFRLGITWHSNSPAFCVSFSLWRFLIASPESWTNLSMHRPSLSRSGHFLCGGLTSIIHTSLYICYLL
jgi:hypothetical protein